MKIINSKIHDIKYTGVIAPLEDSFIFIENRSRIDMRQRGIDHLVSDFSYSGILDGFCVIVTVQIQHDSKPGEILEWRTMVGLDKQVREFVRSLAKQIVFDVKE